MLPIVMDAVRRRLGDAFIATADDPCLEAWLAFHGSCAALSRAQPHTPILNLDIGGGTTTRPSAWQATSSPPVACWWASACTSSAGVVRNYAPVTIRPGAVRPSCIGKAIGDTLTAGDVAAFIDMQMRCWKPCHGTA